MTVSYLIKILESHDPDLEVMVDGYEGGLSNSIGIRQANVELNVNTEDYYGPHEVAINPTRPAIKALILSRQ